MILIGSLVGLVFTVVFLLVLAASFMDFSTAGTLGTNAQQLFDTFPSILYALAIASAGALVAAGAHFVFKGH